MATLNNMVGVTFTSETLTAQIDGYLQNSSRKDIGILEGVFNEWSFTQAANEVTVNEGVLVVQGRGVQNDVSTIDVPLAAGANEFGYVICQIDLSQAAGSQVTIATTQQVGSLPTLQQDSFKTLPATAIYEFPICSYEVSTVGIVGGLTDERVIIDDIEFGDVTLNTTAQTIKGAINENKSNIDTQPNENLLINGNFDIWQRGTSFTFASGFHADRWEFSGSVANTFNRIANTNNNINSQYNLQYIAGEVGVEILQQIENPHNILYNKECSLSFWVKGSVNTTAEARLRNNTQAINIQVLPYNITTSWSKVELTFNADTQWAIDDIIRIGYSRSLGSTGTFEYANVKFEVGDTATEFIPKTEAEELRDCQRYYEKSYDLETTPGSSTRIGAEFEPSTINSSGRIVGPRFKVSKRNNPTITLYSTDSPLVGNVTNNGNKTASAENIGKNKVLRVVIDSPTTGSDAVYHWVADAEL